MTLTMPLLLIAVALVGLSGLAGLFLGRQSPAGQKLAIFLMSVGSGLGLVVAIRCLLGGPDASLDLPWFLPWGSFSLKADALSSFFLVPVFLIPALGSIYGAGYWNPSDRPASARALQFYYGLLAASMAMVVLAHDSVLFLLAWEVMALTAYFLATAETRNEAAGKAGWLYLIGAHVGAVFLFALFALLYRSTGSFAFWPIKAGVLTPRVATTLFLLAIAGFGLKIGLMPLHLFLPGAPASGPCHVSALLSGVVYKVGLYALIRVSGLFPNPPTWWGGLLLFAGAASAILGVAYALAQSNLKRALAYSSFENVGIISMGLGLALLGKTFARTDWTLLGLGGALYHSWNHALMKSLLFYSAGAVERALGTTEIQELGGIAKSLPRTAALFLFGAVAICGLPPLNGFASELMIYLGLFRTAGLGEGARVGGWPLATMAVPCLALTGALAIACFVSLLGTLFLGQRRARLSTSVPGDPPFTMTAPMMAMALLCLVLGLAPMLVLPVLGRATQSWDPAATLRPESLSALMPATWVGAAGAVILGSSGLLVLLYSRMMKRRPMATAGTWDCGYARPTPRMEYSGSSFGLMIRDLFKWALWPRVRRPEVSGLFPKTAELKIQALDPLLDRITLPGAGLLGRGFAWLRRLQQGHLQIYVLYFVVILILLLLWGRSSP